MVLFLIIVIYSITLDGAAQGLNAFFTPDWSQITNGKVWVAAYGHFLQSVDRVCHHDYVFQLFAEKNPMLQTMRSSPASGIRRSSCWPGSGYSVRWALWPRSRAFQLKRSSLPESVWRSSSFRKSSMSFRRLMCFSGFYSLVRCFGRSVVSHFDL